MVGVLAGEAAPAGALAIGEDLGTVEPYIRDYLAARDVLGTACCGSSATRTARRCRRAVATPLPGHGRHARRPAGGGLRHRRAGGTRSRLGLLTRSYREESDESDAVVRAWQEVLEAEGLLPAAAATPAEFTVACYAFLARTPALLIGVSLADAVGDRRPQNIPGTTDEYPNWRVPLCDGEGRAVSLDDLADSRMVRAVARAVAGHP